MIVTGRAVKRHAQVQGYVVYYGNHCVKTYSSTQASIALSSAEAEYYALVKAGSVALGLKAMYGDLGVPVQTIDLHTDASGAKGIALRRGLGKLRHVDVHLLWLQEKTKSGEIILRKVAGTLNPADVLTKHVPQDVLQRHLHALCLSFTTGRAAAAPHALIV